MAMLPRLLNNPVQHNNQTVYERYKNNHNCIERGKYKVIALEN
jgi:hypothetical protein